MGIWDIVAGPILKIIDKVIPDPAAKAAAQLELIRLQQSGELAQLTAETELAKGQNAINLAEAGNASFFVSGWRPFIGWVCGGGLATQFLIRPMAMWVAGLMGHPLEFPTLDLGTLMTLLFGMLGLGAMRTKEKMEGVTK